MSTTNGVYRTPGREAPDAPIASPSRRALFSPLGRALACVLLLAIPPILFNLVLAGPVFGVPKDVRFLPSLEVIQDVIAVLMLGSIAVLVHRIVRRVRPTWIGLRLHTKVLYVAGLLVVQSALVLGAELALFQSRGGLKLFEPTYRTSTTLPDSRTAHLYAGGFGCNYDVYVAAPFSPTMKHTLHVSRESCGEPTPRMHAKEDGSVELIDRDGKPVENNAKPWFFLGGGC